MNALEFNFTTEIKSDELNTVEKFANNRTFEKLSVTIKDSDKLLLKAPSAAELKKQSSQTKKEVKAYTTSLRGAILTVLGAADLGLITISEEIHMLLSDSVKRGTKQKGKIFKMLKAYAIPKLKIETEGESEEQIKAVERLYSNDIMINAVTELLVHSECSAGKAIIESNKANFDNIQSEVLSAHVVLLTKKAEKQRVEIKNLQSDISKAQKDAKVKTVLFKEDALTIEDAAKKLDSMKKANVRTQQEMFVYNYDAVQALGRVALPEVKGDLFKK